MGSLDPAKLLVVLVVALVVIGPERLPRAAQQLGRAWRQLSRVREEVLGEVRRAIPDDLPTIPHPARTVSGFLAELTQPPVAPPPGASGEPERPVARTPVVESSVTFDDPSLN